MIVTYDTYSVDNICFWFQVLIRAGVIFRVVFCLVKIIISDDESAKYRKRIINAVGFLLLSELVFAIKNIVLTYYS